MSVEEIRAKIKESIEKVAGLKTSDIPDGASYKDDLGLDSLSILEIAVESELQFKVKIPDEQLSQLRSVEDTARLVQQYLLVEAA